ncbi:MAG: TRAP transporter small permease subunit [Fimbriimonadaceae bacterium]|nr:TRAP transporter small permease subunit [Alphaproteobacteria bacterium]
MSSLDRIIDPIDKLNLYVGRAVAWLTLAMALVQFIVVVLRYVFAIGFIPMQEAIWYLHGMLFMIGAGFTLLNDGHVRVDVFYREAKTRTKALVDLLGSIFLLMPVCVATFVLSFGYVVNSWTIFEVSTEVSGLPLIFALKTMIWVFAILLGLQGIALMARAVRHLRGESDTYQAGLIGPQID